MMGTKRGKGERKPQLSVTASEETVARLERLQKAMAEALGLEFVSQSQVVAVALRELEQRVYPPNGHDKKGGER